MKTTLETLKTGSVSPGWLAPLEVLRTRTVLGLDISDKQISLALLKRGRNGVELLASANAPLPDGTIKNGCIENAAVLAKTIKDLKKHCRIRTARTSVSLFTEPSVVQIMGIPKQVPGNIGQFIRDQVKHIAVLQPNNIALDFCSVTGAGSGAGRLLVVAADDRKVDEIVKVCGQADLIVEAIEPPLLAYTRALYANRIAGKFDCNVLIAILQGSTLTLCVFKKQAMDFVRTNSIPAEKTQPEEISQWLAEQMNAVIQFYDVEVPDSSGRWEITVVADGEQLPRNAEVVLRAKVTGAGLQIMTNEDICHAAVVNQSSGHADCRRTDIPSPVAIGLAMKLLDKDTHNLKVNLLPPEVTRLRAAQKGVLLTANVIAVTMLIMMLAVAVPERKIANLSKSIDNKKVNLLQSVRTLFEKRASLNSQIDAVSNQINQINAVLDSHRDTDWPGLLNDIGKAMPKTACMISLSGGAGSVVLLKGLATSNEAVYWFVDRLNKSERISLASIAGTERDSRGFVSYEINCTLASKKGK